MTNKHLPKPRWLVTIMFLLTLGISQMWGAVTALTIPKSWDTSDGKSAYTDALGCTLNSIGSDYSSAPKLKFDATGDYIIIQIASAPAYTTFNIKGNPGSGSWSGTFKVQESANGSTYTDAASYTSLANSSTLETVSLKSTTRYIKYYLVTKSNGNVGLGGITIKARTTVTLDKNGGSANGSAVIAYNATAKESITAPTYAGHEIDGYYAEAGCSTKVLNADGSFASSSVSGWITSSKWSKDAATATLYPKWVSTCGAPTAPTKGSVNASSQSVSWTAPTSAPSGGYLVAYSTATSTAPGDAITSTSGNYTVIAVAAGTKTASIPCNAAGTYYWWVRSKCGASEYSAWVAGSSFTMKTIYLKTNANWRTNSAKFAAYFWDATNNGWTPFMGDQTDCEEGVKKVVFPSAYTSMKFVRCNPDDATPKFGDGHAWNETGNLTIPSGKDCFTIPEGDWSSTGNGTSNANWSTYAQKVKVSFDKNTTANGVSDPDAQCVVKSTGKATEPTISDMSHDRLGYELDGWYTAADGGTKITFSSQTYTADTKYYAHWKDGATTKIALDPTWSTYDWRADESVIFAHFYIEGTSQASDVKMIGNSCDDILVANAPYGATHVSFARCKKGTSSLGANWDTDDNIYNYVSGLAIAANYLYSITDWGSGKVGTAQKESSAYTPTSYTISYNPGTGGSGSKTSESKDCDMPFTLPSSAVFTRTGYTQTGWTTSNGGSQTHALGGSYTTNAAQTFYPVWTANKYDVTLKPNNGSGGDQTVEATYASAMPLTIKTAGTAIVVPTRTGYIFNGYWDNASTGTQYYTYTGSPKALGSARNWDKTAATNLYAHWTAKTTTVSFDQNSGTGGQTTTKTATYNQAMPGPVTCPTRSGYVFGGYFDGTTSSAKQYYKADGTSARNWDKEDATCTLYARWYGDMRAWCNPDIDISGDVYLTSYKNVYVQTTEAARNLINISSSDLGGATALEISYLDGSDNVVDKANSVFRLCDGSTYALIDASSSTIDVSGGDAIDEEYSIKYTPNEFDQRDNYKLQIKVLRNDNVLQTKTLELHGRALPQEFVIASKHNGQWYALPNTMGTSLETVTPIKITVDNTTTPTAATYAPTTTVYKGAARYTQTSNVNSIRLTSTGSNWLETGSTAQLSLSTTASPAASVENKQVWYLKSSNFGAYTLKMDPAQSPAKQLGMSGSYMGMYESPTSPSGDIYLLPITNKFTPIAASAHEWGEHGVIVTPETPADLSSVKSATMHVDGASPTSATTTAVNADMGTAKNVKVDGGALTVGAIANDGKQLYIHWKNSGGTEIGVSQIEIPCVIAANGAMKTLIGSKDTWSTKEVHVLPGKTLTANAGSFGSSAVTIKELHIYPGATLDVTTGTLTATTLRLHSGWTRADAKQYNTARVHIADNAALVKTTASIDYDIYEASDGQHYYPFAVPFATAVSSIDYADTYLAGFSTYGKHYGIDYYDGATRASGGNSADNWKLVASDATLQPGKGYTIVALPVKGEAIIRVPLTFDNGWTADGEKATYSAVTKNVVAVTGATGEAASSNQRNEGWYMLGVPFMSCYGAGADMYSADGSAVLIDGKIVVTPGEADPYSYDDESVPYVSVPTHDFSEYIQTDI
ncbi:MAG: InlB B-repeat-containing protein, partial [Paludibacteraceae bacterium]|nr:InlB B-repeat-containing protein [Paludibacteraceae bacterium]